MGNLGRKGFTLIEVIAAVAIMGVLTGTAIAGVGSSLRKSHNSYCSQQVDMMVVAGRDYFNDKKSSLPLELGDEECVNLSTLMQNKYIESMKDYNGGVCNPVNSKVCAMKITGNSYYYTGSLDCGKCSSDNTDKENQAAPTVRFTPENGNAKDKDIVVVMDFPNSQVLSYSYTIFETDASDTNGSRGRPIKQIDFREYDNKKIEIVLNKKGYFYIEGYAYNSTGKKGYKKSGIYYLDYVFDCNTNIKVNAKRSGRILDQKTWVNGAIDINVEATGAVSNYNVIVNNNGMGEKVMLNNATGFSTLTYDDKSTGKYEVVVEAFDSYGHSCRTSAVTYYQDNNPPVCESRVVYNNERNKDYGGEWTNKDLYFIPQCMDLDSGCDVNKNVGKVLNKDYNSNASAGFVYDKAGNSNNCNGVNIKIDKSAPTCQIKLSGTKGNGNYYTSTITANLIANDKNGQELVSYMFGTDLQKTLLFDIEGNSIKNVFSTSDKFTTQTAAGASAKRYKALVYDAAGNVGECQSDDFRLDSIKPKCNFNVTGESTAWRKASKMPVVNLKCTDYIIGNSGNEGSGCKNKSFNDLLGDISLDFKTYKTKTVNQKIYDNAGNYSDCTKDVNVYIDNKKPDCGSWVGNKKWTKNDVSIGIECNEVGNGSGCAKSTFYKKYTKNGEEIELERMKIEICDKAGNCRTCDSGSSNAVSKGTCDSKNCKDGKVYVRHDTKKPVCKWSAGSTKWINEASNNKGENRTIKLTCAGSSGSNCVNEKKWVYGKSKIEIKTKKLTHTLEDAAGNATKCEKNVNVYVDNMPPRILSCGFYNLDSRCIANKPNWKDFYGVGITAYDLFFKTESDYYSWHCGGVGDKNQHCTDGKLLIRERIINNAFGAALCSTDPNGGEYYYSIADEAGNVTVLDGRYNTTINVSCKNFLNNK